MPWVGKSMDRRRSARKAKAINGLASKISVAESWLADARKALESGEFTRVELCVAEASREAANISSIIRWEILP